MFQQISSSDIAKYNICWIAIQVAVAIALGLLSVLTNPESITDAISIGILLVTILGILRLAFNQISDNAKTVDHRSTIRMTMICIIILIFVSDLTSLAYN